MDSGTVEEDYAAISRAAAEADVVVNSANCDDVPLAKAVLAGLERTEKNLPIYLHVRYVVSCITEGCTLTWKGAGGCYSVALDLSLNRTTGNSKLPSPRSGM